MSEPTAAVPFARRLEDLATRVLRIEEHLKLPALQAVPSERDIPAVDAVKAASPPGEQKAQDRSETRGIDNTSSSEKVLEPIERQQAASDQPGRQQTTPPIAPPVQPLASTLADKQPARTGTTAPETRASQPTAITNMTAVAPPVAQPTRQVAPGDANSSRKKTTGSSLEILIAAKWFAWIGAIIVVIGSAFALREFATGIWAQMPDAIKLLSIAGFGGVLVGLGELALRRISRLASVGLFSAGLGVLYMDAYAAFHFYDVVSPNGSFILMGVVALGGFAVTVRTQFRTIGVLSLIGAYATPLLLASDSDLHLPLLAYLTAIFAIALGLSATLPRPFRVLRALGFAGLAVTGGLWMLAHGATHWVLALEFLLLWWVMLLAECMLAATRQQSRIGNVVLSLLGTAAYVTVSCVVINAGTPAGFDWLGVFTICAAVLCGVIALQFGDGFSVLREKPTTALGAMTLGLWVQFGVLAVVAAALHMPGIGHSIAWLAMALGCVELGRRLQSRGIDVFALVVLLVAGIDIATIQHIVPGMHRELTLLTLQNGALLIDRWFIIAMAGVGTSVIAAKRIRTSERGFWQVMPILLMVSGASAWVLAWLIQATGVCVTFAWLAGAAALLSLARHGMPLTHRVLALVFTGLASAHWLLVDVVAAESSAQPNVLIPLANTVLLGAVAIGAMLIWSSRHFRSVSESRLSLSDALLVIGPVVMLLGLSIETTRAIAQTTHDIWDAAHLRWMWWAALWCAGGMLMAGTGRRIDRNALRESGFTITSVAAITWLTFGSLLYRMAEGVTHATPVLNAQMITGLVCACTLAVSAWFTRDWRAQQVHDLRHKHIMSLVLLAAIVLWTGSLEIDRAFAHDAMAAQAWMSVLWGVYGVALVMFGFRRRARAARYAGLALLSLTVAKVLFVDLATVDRLWRVLSFLATGILLIGTSVTYVKFTPRLEAESRERESPADQSSSGAEIS